MARPLRVDAWICSKKAKNVGLLPGHDQKSKPLSTFNQALKDFLLVIE